MLDGRYTALKPDLLAETTIAKQNHLSAWLLSHTSMNEVLTEARAGRRDEFIRRRHQAEQHNRRFFEDNFDQEIFERFIGATTDEDEQVNRLSQAMSQLSQQ